MSDIDLKTENRIVRQNQCLQADKTFKDIWWYLVEIVFGQIKTFKLVQGAEQFSLYIVFNDIA